MFEAVKEFWVSPLALPNLQELWKGNLFPDYRESSDRIGSAIALDAFPTMGRASSVLSMYIPLLTKEGLGEALTVC